MKNIMSVVGTVALALWTSLAVAQETPQTALDEGRVERATELLLQQSTNDDAETSVSGLVGMAQMALSQGHLKEAARHVDEARQKTAALKKNSGWHVVVAWIAAKIDVAQGDMTKATEDIRQAQACIENGAMVALSWTGAVQYLASQIYEADNAKARKAAEAAIAVYLETKQPHERAHARLRLGDLELARGKARRASLEYEAAIRDFHLAQNVEECTARAQLHIARKFLDANDLRAARARMKFAQRDMEIAGNPKELVAMYDEIQNALQTP